jgi:pyruvate formate lyase activating enzyme
LKKINRRLFLKLGFFSSATLAASCFSLQSLLKKNSSFFTPGQEALHYQRLENNAVICNLCNHNCILNSGSTGFCKTRKNYKGTLYSLVYSKPAAVVIEPIEKEPLNHFLPGSNSLCVGTAGCNFSCKFCHNWQLSQREPDQIDNLQKYTPSAIIDLANRKSAPIITFTFNEPTVCYEYFCSIAALAKEAGIKIVMHSNGFMSQAPLQELLPLVDAVTIDLKSFNPHYYQQVCGGELQPVLDNLILLKRAGIWLELVNLVIPNLNDNQEDIRAMCRWINEYLGSDTPLVFSRFHPAYKLADLYPTPLETLEAAHSIAKKQGLEYVTLGNTPGHKLNSTYCPDCGRVLIERIHISLKNNNIINGLCRFCGKNIPGIWT